jgi:hypothetical protein
MQYRNELPPFNKEIFVDWCEYSGYGTNSMQVSLLACAAIIWHITEALKMYNDAASVHNDNQLLIRICPDLPNAGWTPTASLT